MSLYKRIQELASTRSISIAELERNLDFANGSMRKWDKHPPGISKLQKVADYFDVSTDYLLGRTNEPNLFINEDTFGNDLINHFRLNTANLNTEDIEELEEELKEYTEFLIERAKKKKRN